MNQQDKKNYTDRLQKNLNRSCYEKCKQDQNCYKACFDKYMKTIAIVNLTIKSLAYQKLSLVGYKAYPEHNINQLFNIQQDLMFGFDDAPFAVQHDVGA